MFFVISKILSYLLSPLFWILALMILSFFIKNRKKSRRILLVTIVLFYLLSNHFIVDEFMRVWEEPMTEYKDLAKEYDVGVVLGGYLVTIDKKYDRLIFKKNTDRILQAVDLYNNKKIKKILISGGPGNIIYHDMYEAPLLKRFLMSLGIPDTSILVDSTSNNTYENAVNSKKIINENFPENIKALLITSSLHMRRAAGCFRKQNIDFDKFPTDKYIGENRRYNVEQLFIPDLDSFIYWRMFIHEFTGYYIYKMMGYI